MVKKSKKLSKEEMDLNGDGVVDEKDKSVAAKVLASDLDKVEDVPEEVKEEPIPEKKSDGMYCTKDISLTYRKGDFVPQDQIDKWEKCGIDWKVWF